MVDDMQIVMQYTGWSREIAVCAIRQWKRYDHEWNAKYILMYLRPAADSELSRLPDGMVAQGE